MNNLTRITKSLQAEVQRRSSDEVWDVVKSRGLSAEEAAMVVGVSVREAQARIGATQDTSTPVKTKKKKKKVVVQEVAPVQKKKKKKRRVTAKPGTAPGRPSMTLPNPGGVEGQRQPRKRGRKKVAIDEDRLAEMVDAGETYTAMAKEFGVSDTTIKKRLKEFGLI